MPRSVAVVSPMSRSSRADARPSSPCGSKRAGAELLRGTVALAAAVREAAWGDRGEEQEMAAVQGETPGAQLSLRDKMLRRKPVGGMSSETGADTDGGERGGTK